MLINFWPTWPLCLSKLPIFIIWSLIQTQFSVGHPPRCPGGPWLLPPPPISYERRSPRLLSQLAHSLFLFFLPLSYKEKFIFLASHSFHYWLAWISFPLRQFVTPFSPFFNIVTVIFQEEPMRVLLGLMAVLAAIYAAPLANNYIETPDEMTNGTVYTISHLFPKVS